MFLTRIDIDPNRRLARKYLSSPQIMHAVVMKAATPSRNAPSNEGRVLWRVDKGAFGLTLYVLSPDLPEISQLAHEVGMVAGDARTLDYAPFLHRLSTGQTWAFRLTANPSHSVSRGQDVRGKRFGHVTAEQQREWLVERSSKHGFDLRASPRDPETVASDTGAVTNASVLVVRRDRPVFSRQSPQGGRDRVTINSTVFEGILQISDVAAFRSMLTHGLGPSKAYGCGLMTLAPVTRS